MPAILRLIRFDKPTGSFLLLWPCLFAITLADSGPRPLFLIAMFTLGAFIMRSAGCVINDMADRKIDAKVARTKSRPLASGELTMTHAVSTLLALLIAGFLVLITFNLNTILFGALALIPVTIYPFAKRFTNWPQAILALTINWGALLGFIAVNNSLSPAAFTLYTACFFWTLGYDTIYGHQDKKDDKKIGVKSTSLTLGDSKAAIYFFYIIMLTLLLITGYLANVKLIFYPLITIVLLLALLSIKKADLNNPKSCMQNFKMNAALGGAIWLCCLLGMLDNQSFLYFPNL